MLGFILILFCILLYFFILPIIQDPGSCSFHWWHCGWVHWWLNLEQRNIFQRRYMDWLCDQIYLVKKIRGKRPLCSSVSKPPQHLFFPDILCPPLALDTQHVQVHLRTVHLGDVCVFHLNGKGLFLNGSWPLPILSSTASPSCSTYGNDPLGKADLWHLSGETLDTTSLVIIYLF